MQVAKKIEGICLNPEIGEPKSHNLRGLRGLHVTEHYVIVYFIFRHFVIFIELDLHDKAYAAAGVVAARLIYDTRLLAALEAASITQQEFADFLKTIGRPKWCLAVDTVKISCANRTFAHCGFSKIKSASRS